MNDEGITIWNAKSMFDAARVLGSAIRRVQDRDGSFALKSSGVDFNVSLIFGGQIQGRRHAPVPGVFGGQLYRSHE
jgi:putative proteasome-type protease